MVNYSNNPNTVYNGMVSSLRNMFLASSIAIVIIGLSNRFYNYRNIIKIMASILFILSIYIGIKTITDFNYYLERNKDTLPDYVPYDSWRSWKYVVYIYVLILIALLIIIILKNMYI